MNKPTRTVVLVLAALFGLGCLATVGVVAVFAAAFGGLGSGEAWSEDAVPERDLAALFGVRLPVKPLRYQSRQLGFQDAYYEVLVQLPPAAAPALLEQNGLTRGQQRPCPADLLEAVRALDPAAPPLQSTGLELAPALKPDGGAWGLHRTAELLEGEGALWLHLVAFET